MKEFKASEKKVKASLELDGETYKFYAPTVGQADKFSKLYEDNKSDSKKMLEIMIEYICELGNMPKDKVLGMENDMFMSLFNYLTEPVKKN